MASYEITSCTVRPVEGDDQIEVVLLQHDVVTLDVFVNNTKVVSVDNATDNVPAQQQLVQPRQTWQIGMLQPLA